MLEQYSILGGMAENRQPTAGQRSVYATLGARNFAQTEREQHDFYATSPVAIDKLMQIETFQKNILEPCCGMGHMSEAIKAYGHDVESFDLIDHGYGSVHDFMTVEQTDRDIITNPPFKDIAYFIAHAVGLLRNKGQKLALFMRILTLEGQARKLMFEKFPPVRVWISSSRIKCAKGGDFEGIGSSVQAYAWFVWQAGYQGETVLKWF